MSKKKQRNKNTAPRDSFIGTPQGDSHAHKQIEKNPKLQIQKERKPVPAISLSSRVFTIAEFILASVLWIYSAYMLMPIGSMLSNVLLALIYFFCCLVMYLTRCALESKRRYGKTNHKAMFYYSQVTAYDRRWSIYISLAFFVVITLVQWLIPIGKYRMTTIDIASCFYLGYVWTTTYKGERIPYQYMETVFLFVTMATNIILLAL